jgi:acyl-CoA synthetase (AMP-forming)/AMP-acid ligase II
MPLIVNDVLACAAGTAPGRLAVTLGEETMTFGQVESLANRFSHALLSLGARPGERVAWWSETSLLGVGLFFASSRIGTAFVPLNPASPDDEVTAALGYLRPQFLIVDPAHAARAEHLVDGHDTAWSPWAVGLRCCPGWTSARGRRMRRPPLRTCRCPRKMPSAPSS